MHTRIAVLLMLVVSLVSFLAGVNLEAAHSLHLEQHTVMSSQPHHTPKLIPTPSSPTATATAEPTPTIPKREIIHVLNCASAPVKCGDFERGDFLKGLKDTQRPKDYWNLCSFMNLKCFGTLYHFGIPKHIAGAASHADILFLDFLASVHQECRYITELGVAHGVTSLHLGMISRARDTAYHGYDIEDDRPPVVMATWLPNMEFFREDILHSLNSTIRASMKGIGDGRSVNEHVIASISRGKSIVFVDNGSKAWEATHYCQFLEVGSIVAIHDWNEEVGYDDVKDVFADEGYVRIWQDVAHMLGTHVRAFLRVNNGNDTLVGR